MEAAKLVATITPTPGQVISRRQVGSSFAIADLAHHEVLFGGRSTALPLQRKT
jgi:hypothetical protein